MPFQKGASGNPKGRPKGAKGAVSATVQEAITEAMHLRIDRIASKLDQIKDPVQWLEMYIRLSAFIVPRNPTPNLEPYNPFPEDMSEEEIHAYLMEGCKIAGSERGLKVVPVTPLNYTPEYLRSIDRRASPGET
jgi:Family of unknown function (DUF5681)